MLAQSWRSGHFRGAAKGCAERVLNSIERECGGARWEQLLSKPGGVTAIAAELRLLGKAKSLSHGKLLHAHIHACGFDLFTFVGNCLIDMYANCGSLEDAVDAFDRLPNPNVYSWNLLIKAYGQNGFVPDAFHVFASMPLKDSVSWNAIISIFTQHGHSKHALELFDKMKKESFVPNNITFISTLDACADLADLREGQDIHASIVSSGCDRDVLVGTALVNMYGKGKRLREAMDVFHKLGNRDVISWNAMISLFSQMNSRKQTLHCFQQMLAHGLKPNMVSFICILEACALEEGQVVHAFILESCHDQDVEVCTALFTMYGNSGSLHDAMHVFQRMPCRSIVSWNTMIALLAQNTCGKDSFKLYKRMRSEGFEPDNATFTSVIDACASFAALDEGRDVHAAIIFCHYELDILVCNALISLYGDCGSLCDARRVFDRMQCRDLVSWTALITASVQNGHHEQALCLFQCMQNEGFKPDNITFISILTACARSGWLDEGKHFFVSMNRDYRLSISGEHYLCLIYLLSRAGHLDDAEELIEYTPSGKAGMAWLSLLGACKVHGDIERGLNAAENCVKFTPQNVASYVLLSNIYAADQFLQDIE